MHRITLFALAAICCISRVWGTEVHDDPVALLLRDKRYSSYYYKTTSVALGTGAIVGIILASITCLLIPIVCCCCCCACCPCYHWCHSRSTNINIVSPGGGGGAVQNNFNVSIPTPQPVMIQQYSPMTQNCTAPMPAMNTSTPHQDTVMPQNPPPHYTQQSYPQPSASASAPAPAKYDGQ